MMGLLHIVKNVIERHRGDKRKHEGTMITSVSMEYPLKTTMRCFMNSMVRVVYVVSTRKNLEEDCVLTTPMKQVK